MKQNFILLALILITAFYVQAQTSNRKNKSVEQKLLQLQRAEDEAEARKDTAALERIFSDDFVFIAANGEFYDKKKFLDEIKNDAEPPAPAQTVDYEDFKARVFGKMAIVNYVLVVTGKDKNEKTFSNRYRMSSVWVKQKNIWRLANIHATRIRV